MSPRGSGLGLEMSNPSANMGQSESEGVQRGGAVAGILLLY